MNVLSRARNQRHWWCAVALLAALAFPALHSAAQDQAPAQPAPAPAEPAPNDAAATAPAQGATAPVPSGLPVDPGKPVETQTKQAEPAPVPEALVRARKHVQAYFDKFSDLTCKESVAQLVLNGSGHTIYRENSAFDYQFQTTIQDEVPKFIETRETRNPAFRDPARTLLVTTGFANLLLVVHPMYESSYTFEPAGHETIGGASYALIRFAPVPGASSPATLRLRGRNYPMPMSGTLWIDPQSGAIVKLEAIVDSSLNDLGLKAMRSEVHYVQHTFHNPEASLWIADSAIIDVQTPRQHWRNLHHFSDYKRFSVDVHEQIGQLP